MAKLVDPLLSQSASGSIGGALSYGNRLGKNIVRAYSRPKRQRTYAQGQQSERYQAYKNEWNLLYPARKAVFSARAVEQGRVSGFHQFLHENLQPDMVGQTLLAPEQVGLWHFNTGSGGTAYDATQYHNDGTLQGPVWTPGKYGDGLYFDGVNDYVDCGVPAVFSITETLILSCSFMLFSLPSSLGTFRFIIKYFTGQYLGWSLHLYNTGSAFQIECAYISGVSWHIPFFLLTPVLRQWYSVVFFHDTLEHVDIMFLNNVQQNINYRIGAYSDVIVPGNAPVNVGGWHVSGYSLHGLLDDVVISQ